MLVENLINKIQQNSATVTSREVTDCVKVANYNLVAAGSAGLGLGALGTYLAMQNRMHKAKRDAETKALLGTALGASLGYYAGAPTSGSGMDYSPYETQNTSSISSSDMDDIFGRRYR